MIEVIPAILPKTYDELNEKLGIVAGLVGSVQIDITDGIFVDSKTWPYAEEFDHHFENILHEMEGLPYWESFDFEFDLMIDKPEKKIDKWLSIGAKRLVIHKKSTDSLESIISLFKDIRMNREANFYTELGIAIETDESPASLLNLVEEVDFIQCMGISKIGKQGQEFDEGVLEQLRYLRKHYPETILSVDGAVALETAPKLIKAGANRLISGSYIFKSSNPEEAIRALEQMG